jgi:hypothetical protein
MSERVHFWLRVASLVTILAAEFGPRLWSGAPSAAGHVASREGDGKIAVQQASATGR